MLRIPELTYESIEKTLNKKDFITHLNNFSKKHLDKIINAYKEDGTIKEDDCLFRFINNFYTIGNLDAEKYHHLEIDFTKYLKKILAGTKSYNSIYMKPLAGAIYYFLAICQLAQNKNHEAEINFFEAYNYSSSTEIGLASLLANLYARVSGHPTAEKIVPACRFDLIFKHDLKSFFDRPENQSHAVIKIIYTMISKHLQSYPPTRDITAKGMEIATTLALYQSMQAEAAKKNPDELELKKMRKRLFHYKYFDHTINKDNDNLVEFFSSLVLDQLDEVANLNSKNKKNKNSLRNHYHEMADYFIEAMRQHLPLITIISNVRHRIPLENKTTFYPHIKGVLELLAEQIKTDDALFCLFHGDKDLKNQLSLFSTKQPAPCDLKISDGEFIKEDKNLVKDALINLREMITPGEYKDNCSILITEFLNNTDSDYKKLFDECTKLITSLYEKSTFQQIQKNHGPILDILYYIASICDIALSNGKKSSSFYLNEGLNQPHLLMKDHLHLARAYIRSKYPQDYTDIHGAIYDLDQIPEDSSCSQLKNKIYIPFTQYIKKQPAFHLARDEKIATLLTELENAILADNFKLALEKQAEYEKNDEYKIHLSQEVEYNFWMTIFYLKLYAKATDNKTHASRSLLHHLKVTLLGTPDLLSTLFRFKDVISKIYGNDDKPHIRAFHDEVKNCIIKNKHKDIIASLIFDKFVLDYCSIAPIQQENMNENGNTKKIDTKEVTAEIVESPINMEYEAPSSYQSNKEMATEPPVKDKDEVKKANADQPNETNPLQTKKPETKKPEKNIKKKQKQTRFTVKEKRQMQNNINKAQRQFAQINKREGELRLAEQQIEKLETEIATSKIQLSQLENKLNQANDNLNKVQAEIIEVESEIRKTEDHLSQNKATVMRLTQEIIQLQIQLIENKMRANENLIRSKEEELAPIKTAIVEVEEAIQITEQINDKETQIQLAKDKIHEAASKIKKRKEAFGLKDQEIFQLEEEIRQEKLRCETKKEQKISNQYLMRFFSAKKDFETLSTLNRLARDRKRTLILQGSTVFNLYLNLLGDEESLALAKKKTSTDIDIYVNCIGTDSKGLRDKLMDEPNNYTLIKEGSSFINLNKKLTNGLTLDLVIKTGYNTRSKFIPSMCGEAFIEFIEFPDGKYSPILRMDKENVSFKDFAEACEKREMLLGMPGFDTRNCLFLAYKATRDYHNAGIIKINNLKAFRARLYDYYKKALIQCRNNIYFDLISMVKHDATNETDKVAVKYLKLIFNAFFDFKEAHVDINEFVKFFISCKDDLFLENDIVFKEQIDLMISLYLKKDEGHDLNEIRDEIKNLKLLYLQSIEPPEYPEYQQYPEYLQYPQVAQTYMNQPQYPQYVQQGSQYYPQYMQEGPQYYPQQYMEQGSQYYPQYMQQTSQGYQQYMQQASQGYQQYMQQASQSYQQYMQASQENYQYEVPLHTPKRGEGRNRYTGTRYNLYQPNRKPNPNTNDNNFTPLSHPTANKQGRQFGY